MTNPNPVNRSRSPFAFPVFVWECYGIGDDLAIMELLEQGGYGDRSS